MARSIRVEFEGAIPAPDTPEKAISYPFSSAQKPKLGGQECPPHDQIRFSGLTVAYADVRKRSPPPQPHPAPPLDCAAGSPKLT